jgi:hypothetical protein
MKKSSSVIGEWRDEKLSTSGSSKLETPKLEVPKISEIEVSNTRKTQS